MKYLYEKLYFYYISLKTQFISFDKYIKWLDDIFLVEDTSDDVLLELQFCTFSLEETINVLYIYLYDKLNILDYQVVMKLIVRELKIQYENKDLLYDITKKLYNIWCLLPVEISHEKPFLILNFIDDPWSWGGEKEIIKNIDNLLKQYE